MKPKIFFSAGSTLKGDADDLYYWRTQNGAGLDLLIFQGGNRIGYEFKYTDSPKVTLSMHIAPKDLALEPLNIVVPRKDPFPIHEQINVMGLDSLKRSAIFSSACINSNNHPIGILHN